MNNTGSSILEDHPVDTDAGDNTSEPRALPWQNNNPWLWLATASLSIATTRRLQEDGFHYPMYLLLFHLLGTIALRLSRHIQSPEQPLQTAQTLPSATLVTWKTILMTLGGVTCAFCIAGGLVFGYQAILLVHNIPAVTILLALDWQPEHVWAALLDRSSYPGLPLLGSLVFKLLLRLCGMTMILYFDFRLDGRGTAPLIRAACLLNVAQLIRMIVLGSSHFADGSSTQQSSSIISSVRRDISSWALLCSVPLTIIAIGRVEDRWHRGYDLPLPNLLVLVVNIVASAIALDNSVALFQHMKKRGSSNDANDDDLPSWIERRPLGRFALSMLLVGLTLGFTTFICSQPPLLSVWQIAGFVLAGLTPITAQDADHVAKQVQSARPRYNLADGFVGPDSRDVQSLSQVRRGSSTLQQVLTTALLLSGLSMWPLVLIRSFAPAHHQSALTNVSLDASYQADRALDIVINRFSETREDIVKTLSDVLRPSNLHGLRPRIVIYDKGTDLGDHGAFSEHLKQQISWLEHSEITVTPLENTGREAAAYLDHIISHWDDLANHTLFMQGHVHEMDSAIRRIEDYFVPSTGFLSISYVGKFCRSCETCADLSWWRESPEVLKELYSATNHGAKCKDIVLTYRGQFIVSAARLRGNDKAIYEDLRMNLVDSNSGVHSPQYTSDKPESDSLNAPVFGYTLERMWGVVMQCSDLRVAYRCPSMSSVLRTTSFFGGPDRRDCQCLDDGT